MKSKCFLDNFTDNGLETGESRGMVMQKAKCKAGLLIP